MALWFVAKDGRKVYKPPYTKAEQMAIYKRYAEGPKVIVKHIDPHLGPQPRQEEQRPQPQAEPLRS